MPTIPMNDCVFYQGFPKQKLIVSFYRFKDGGVVYDRCPPKNARTVATELEWTGIDSKGCDELKKIWCFSGTERDRLYQLVSYQS